MSAESRVVWMSGGVRTEIHLDSTQTAGAFCLLVDHPPVGWSLPAHRHRNEAETIHIVEGEFEMDVNGQRSRRGLAGYSACSGLTPIDRAISSHFQ